MNNYSKITKRDTANINDEVLSEDITNENRELFKRALSEAIESKIRKIDEETEDMTIPPPSRRHKIRMNRLFRERVRSAFLPFPEVDNLYERVRSRLVIKLKINDFFDRKG